MTPREVQEILERSRQFNQHVASLMDSQRLQRIQEAQRIQALLDNRGIREAVQKQLDVMREQLLLHVTTAAEAVRKQTLQQFEHWSRHFNGLTISQHTAQCVAQALSAGEVWRQGIENLVQAMKNRQIDVRFPLLAERIVRPSEYFSQYARTRTEQLDTTEDKERQAVLCEALSLAETEFVEGAELTESLIGDDVGVTEPSVPFLYNLYEEQESELILLVRKDGLSRIESVSSIFDHLRTTEISRMATQVIRLISVCNRENRSRGGEDLFKLTNATIEAAADMPLLIVRDNGGLLSLVLHLYRLIYEGAGSDKLRFLKEQGGCLEREECEIVWTLKTLRNKLTTHDPEHGDESKIRKSYADLRTALQGLGLDGLPVATDDYLLIQQALISKTGEFLMGLLERLQA